MNRISRECHGMLPNSPTGSRTTQADGAEAAVARDKPQAEALPDPSATESTPQPPRRDTSNLRVAGFVDTFRPPNFLSGWAKYEGREDSPDDQLDLRILLDGEVIGTGQTGDIRRRPAGRCGFNVTLSRPITIADIRGQLLKVFAMDKGGASHRLPVAMSRLLRVRGFVDSFKPPNVLGGWARQDSSGDSQDQTLDISVLLDGNVIGNGTTGLTRPEGRGFRVTLSVPITMMDIRSKAIKVYAIDAGGDVHELPPWQKLLDDDALSEPTDAWHLRLAEIEKLIGRRSSAASKPYRTDGIVLAPACTAPELRPIIESEGLFGYLPDLSVPTALKYLKRDNLPIPRRANREFYCGDQDVGYWLFGLADYLKVRACWQKSLSRVRRILDFGGSTGRVFRHFYCQGEIDEVYACDSNKVNIQWCKAYFPPDIRVFLNTFYPGLPFADGYFDMITAFSVFTHIDDFEDGWLLELSRILKPNGIAYITIHDEAAWEVMPLHLQKAIGSSPGANGVDFKGPMPSARMVFPAGDQAPYGLNVFHRQDHVQRFWDRHFHIVEIIPQGHHFQTVLVLRNRRGERRRAR
jgi:SAM-dependent methyltransferase